MASADMDVDSASTGVAAGTGTSSGVSISLHPLVIMNVSEHWTRVKVQEGRPMEVIGALIGKQSGRNVEIMNSFELKFAVIEGCISVDKEYYNTKEKQFKQVFPDLDFLGWYGTGNTDPESDMKIHTQIVDITENPIFLKLDPLAVGKSELPIAIFDSRIELVGGNANRVFVELQYSLATEEAERIGIDHIAKVSNTNSSESNVGNVFAVADHLAAQHSAIKMLHKRVQIILEYLKAVEEGTVPKNHEVLREAYSLCHRLPVMNTGNFTDDFYTQCCDVSVMAYLGLMTKSANNMNQFVNKFKMLHEAQGMGRRTRGMVF